MPKTMLKTNVRKELPTGPFTRTYRLFSLIAAWPRERALLYNQLVHLWSKALDDDLQVDAVFLDVKKDALRSRTPQDTVPLINCVTLESERGSLVPCYQIEKKRVFID